MTVSPIEFKRFTLAKESAWKTPGSYTAPRGYKKEGTLNHGYTTIPIDNALNSKGDRYAPEPNMQTFDCSVSFINASTFANFTDIFTAALGLLETDTTLTFSSSSTNVGAIISGGGPSGIIQVTGSDNKKYLVMAALFAGGTDITYWPSLPVGITTTALVNLSGTPSGGVFEYALGGNATTFSLEFDWANLPSSTTQNNVLASGCAIKSCQLVWARDKLLELKLEFIGASYTEDAGASANNTDPAVFSNAFLGWTGDWFLSSGTPVWGTNAAPGTDQVRAKALTIEMAPEVIVETGAQGLDGGSTVSSVLAGSDITGYTRNAIGTQQVTIRVPYNIAYETAFKAKTAYGLFGVMYSGVGGGVVSAHRVALGIRRMVQSAKPVIVEDGGGRYHDLTFQIERDLTSNTNVERIHLGFVTA